MRAVIYLYAGAGVTVRHDGRGAYHDACFGESIANGEPPVITTVGTPWSDLNSSEAGAWIEIGTEPLVETLRRFLGLSEDELETMGRNGRKLIETKYSAHVMAEQMMEVYKGL